MANTDRLWAEASVNTPMASMSQRNHLESESPHQRYALPCEGSTPLQAAGFSPKLRDAEVAQLRQ